MSDMSEIKRLLIEQGDSWAEHKTQTEEHFKAIERELALVKMGPAAPYRPSDDTRTPTQRKATADAYKAWLAGDVAGLERATNELKALRAGVDPDGGYVVPVEVGPMIRRMAEISPLVGLANQIPLRAGDAVEGLEDLGQFPTASWVGEEQARPETGTSTLGKYRIELGEMYSMPSVTQKLLDVADIDVAAWAEGKILESFAVTEEAGMITGTGVGQMRGINTFTTAATADATRAWGQFEHVVSGANGAFKADSAAPADPLIELTYKLKSKYLSRARWFMPRSVAARIRTMKESTSGAFLWQPSLVAGQPDRLLGYPVTFVDALPSLATGSLSIWFGDMSSAYTVIRRGGFKLLTDPYTAKPKVLLYAYQRVGGAPVDFEAIKAVKFST